MERKGFTRGRFRADSLYRSHWAFGTGPLIPLYRYRPGTGAWQADFPEGPKGNPAQYEPDDLKNIGHIEEGMPGIGFPDVNSVAEAIVIFPADRGSIPQAERYGGSKLPYLHSGSGPGCESAYSTPYRQTR